MARYRTAKGIALTEENRFSVYVDPDDSKGYADLMRWEEWFKGCEIPCVIAQTADGYALYRLGLDDA